MFMPARDLHFDQFSLVTQGGYADIYKSNVGLLCNDGQTRQFGMKVFRVAQGDFERIAQLTSITNELSSQQLLLDYNHDSLCSIEIINTTTAAHFLCGIVMPWCNGGHVLNYVQQQPSANKLDLIVDIASKLKHLHSFGVVHGNLKPDNILVTDRGQIYITDIGVNSLVIQTVCKGFHSVPPAWAYKAPEEIMFGTRDQRTDVYSFACLVYALYIAGPPFRPLRYPYLRGLEWIVDGGHLQLLGPPEGMSEGLWYLLKSCWNREPAHRSTMAEIEKKLLKMQCDN